MTVVNRDYVKCVVRYSDGDELDYFNQYTADFLSENENVNIYNPFKEYPAKSGIPTDKEWEDWGFLVLHI